MGYSVNSAGTVDYPFSFLICFLSHAVGKKILMFEKEQVSYKVLGENIGYF